VAGIEFPARKQAHRWKVRQIDSRTCALPNQAQIAEWLRRVGLFPRARANQQVHVASARPPHFHSQQ
jgi:hypothetical protein